MYMQIKKLMVLFSSLCIIFSCSNNNNNDKTNRIYSKNICSEHIAPFYYESNNPNIKDNVKDLCDCLWKKLPVNGWERKVSTKLYEGKDIGWKIKSFSTIFESNYDKCVKELMFND